MTSAFTASVAAFLVTLLSGLAALTLRKHKSLVFASCAGALIGGAFLFLLPDALELFERSGTSLHPYVAWLFAVSGFLVFYALERGHHSAGSTRLAGLGGGIGLAVHSFIDGVLIGQAIRTGGEIGFVLAAAVMLHRIADGVSAVGIMLGTEHGIGQTATLLLVTSTAPVAGALAQSFVAFPTFLFALLLSFFSGMLFYLGARRLLPEARRASASGATVAASFLGGVGLVFAAYLLAH